MRGLPTSSGDGVRGMRRWRAAKPRSPPAPQTPRNPRDPTHDPTSATRLRFTAAVAAHFVEDDEGDLAREVGRLHEELDEMDETLARLVERLR